MKAISYTHWSSQSINSVEQAMNNADVVLLAISDDAIDLFLETHSTLQNKPCVHFSGAHHSQLAWGYHPLMTFGQERFDQETYESILFVQQDDTPDFKNIFPCLTNPSIKISAQDKAYYHALCVMANNFTTLLWQKFFQEMSQRFNAHEDAMKTFLNQTLTNISANPEHALTGPLIRNDQNTLKKNMEALSHDPFLCVYQSFVQSYQAKKSN